MGEWTLIFWIAVLIVTLAVEALTMGLTAIWFSGGALLAVVVALVKGPFWLQIIAFFVVSVVLLVFTRPLAIKYFNRDRVRTNVESLVGRQAIVLTEVNNIKGIGQVSVGGQEWSARSYADSEKLEQGQVVLIVAISGVKLICRPVSENAPAADEAKRTVQEETFEKRPEASAETVSENGEGVPSNAENAAKTEQGAEEAAE